MLRRRMMRDKQELPAGAYSPGSAPVGVYIHIASKTGSTKKNYLIKRDKYNSSMRNEAIGVAIITEDCRFTVPATNTMGDIWGDTTKLINNITTTTSPSTLLTDFTGRDTTTKIIEQIPTTLSCAARRATKYGYLGSTNGYLGSVGEWRALMKNFDEAQTCLTILNYGLVKDIEYWTTAQHSVDKAYTYRIDGGLISAQPKDKQLWVIAFLPI